MPRYCTTLRFQFPAWDEASGIDYEIAAPTKAKATKYAKIQAERDGHWPNREKGRATFTSVQIAN